MAKANNPSKSTKPSSVQISGKEKRLKRRRAKIRAEIHRENDLIIRSWVKFFIKWRIVIIVCFAIITTVSAVIFGVPIIQHQQRISGARQEYEELLKISPFDAEWFKINPDYVGWLKIEDTVVNFPVVRGDDNSKYLKTIYSGKKNMLGSIFMDYRCVEDDAPHIIIYGHEVRGVYSELMFGGLKRFLDKQYLANHPTIMFMKNNILSEFEIFSARMSDINDPAYQLDFNAPDSFNAFLEQNGAPTDATQIITLSTCVGAGNDKRMIVQGSLKSVFPVLTEYDENGGWTITKP